MVSRFGMGRYLAESGARQIDSDQFGVLYKKDQHDDEPIVVVKVTDASTVEDGEPRQYFLRVPPYIASARQAVAWTFNLAPREYDPALEA
jgi:hypothetical protein